MSDPSNAPHLSDRQAEILRHRAHGATRAEIAAVMYLAVGTVDYHERVIVTQLRARNITHAVHLAHRAGLLTPYDDCGDRNAYDRHRYRGEVPDPACRAANAARSRAQWPNRRKRGRGVSR